MCKERLSPYETVNTRGTGIGTDIISPENMKIMHEKLLETTVYFDAFCQQHGLTYALVWGTCIGAVRHHGFIPWDDDVDIAMPRADYNKLFELWEKYGDKENYSLYRTTEDFCAKAPIGLLRNNNTTIIYDFCQDQDIKHGIKLDIEPWDEVPDGWFPRKVQYIQYRLYEVYATQRLPKSSPSLKRFRNLKIGIIKAMLTIAKTKKQRFRIADYMLRRASRYNGTGCEYVRCNADSAPVRKEDLFNTIRVPFENVMLQIPRGYDDILRKQAYYGDYMQKPPVEKRVPNVGCVFYDLNSSCDKYKGIHYCIDKN